MIWVYFDASALVKRYSAEQGTSLVNNLFSLLPVEQITCAVIGVLEIVSVLVRKRNDGRIPTSTFNNAMKQLDKEIIQANNFSLATIDDFIILSSLNLIEQHNINTTDALILRSCLNIQKEQSSFGNQVILWSCDKRLLRAATNEGLQVFDPEVNTNSDLQLLMAKN